MDAREGLVEWRLGRTWYRVAGELDAPRAPLLCLHGGPGSTHHYFAPLERLAGERAVVLYDQLGCGSSDRPRNVEWSLAVFLEELAELRTRLGLARVHLLGTSWGGMLALEHALSGAGGLASLILSSTLADGAHWAAESRRLRDELPPETVAAMARHEAAGTYDDPAYRAALDEFEARHFHRGDRDRPELRRMRAGKADDVYRAMWGPNEWEITGALAGWDVTARLHELDVPTLVVRGAHDQCTDAIAATLVGGIAGAREAVLPESSHTPVLEETDLYLDVVGGFLREVEARA